MGDRSVDILVFGGDSDFFAEIGGMLLNVGLNSITYTDKTDEAEAFLRRSKNKVMIYDSLYGGSDVRRLIRREICSNERAFCIYICERRDEELFNISQPQIVRLNRPYSLQSFYESVLHVTYSLRNSAVTGGRTAQEAESIDQIPVTVTDSLHDIGVPAHIKGFAYLRYSIVTVVNEPDMIDLITKNLYVNIANQFNTTAVCVERAIRHAIDLAWERGNIALLNAHFGHTVRISHGRPSNSEFIATISNSIRKRFNVNI